MDMIRLSIDNRKIIMPKDLMIIEAAEAVGIKIPSLCYHPELISEGTCRVCMVSVKGVRSLVASCVYPIAEGMEVRTNTGDVLEARKTVVELLLANHPRDCFTCQRNTDCELQTIAANLGIRKIRFQGEKKNYSLDWNNPALIRDQNKCIICRRCVRVCSDIQEMHVYSSINRGFTTKIAPAFDEGLDKVACTYCGQCASVCPTAAIVERSFIGKVFDALTNSNKHVVVQTAPAVRVALGEEFGIDAGEISTGKMVASLRRLGFDKVFDTTFAADLTIVEEAAEFLERLERGGKFPMITSCPWLAEFDGFSGWPREP